jgi:predicted metal-binding membrane protein
MRSEHVSRHAFFAVSALIFAASATGTVAWCASMSAMGEMPMPGGWTMSMAWTRMCGQTWAGCATSFVGMWVVMMVAMMSPSFAPVLWHYRGALGRANTTRRVFLTVLAGAGYFFVWTALGVAAFVSGVALASLEMRMPALARAVPLAAGVVVFGGGVLQLTSWKARHLACCRAVPGRGRALPALASAAWQYGVRHGLHCGSCCAGLTAILLVIGMMNLVVMALVTAAITAERVAPAGERMARAVGVVAAGEGVWLIVRALGFA